MNGRGFPGASWLRLDALALFTILVVAAIVRFVDLDLMEFKADEAEATRLALHVLGLSEPGVGRFFPTAGLTSSVGTLNPPLFIYLIALPLAIVRSPLAAAGFVAALNVVAVWLTYVVGKRYYSNFVGIASAALFTLAPWGIIFSRKIWAQNMLPIFAALFLLQLHAFLVEKRPRALCWLIILVAAAAQLHFSAWILAVVLLVAIVLGRRTIAWRWAALGLGGALALYAPFLAYHARAVYDSLGSSYGAPDAIDRFRTSVHFMFSISGGDYLSFLLGSQSGLARPVSLIVGPAAFIGLLAACRQWRSSPVGRLRVLLVVWYLLPLAALTVLPVPIHIHYFIILLPLPFLGMASLIEWLTKRQAAIGWLALTACLCSFAVLDGQIYRTVAHDDGAPGDYGVAYKYKADATAMLERESQGRKLELGEDVDFAPGSYSQEYHLLDWNSDPDYVRLTPAVTGYVIINKLVGTPPLLRADPKRRSYRTQRFGPLRIVAIPLGK